MTGSIPGMAASTSETRALASPPNSVEAPENNLARELTWAWTSMPITTSQSPVEPLISLVFCEGASMRARPSLLGSSVTRLPRVRQAPLAGPAGDNGPLRKRPSTRAFRRAERTETGQDLDQRAVVAELLHAPIGLRTALERVDRAGIHRPLLDRAGAGRQFDRLHRFSGSGRHAPRQRRRRDECKRYDQDYFHERHDALVNPPEFIA